MQSIVITYNVTASVVELVQVYKLKQSQHAHVQLEFCFSDRCFTLFSLMFGWQTFAHHPLVPALPKQVG